VTKTAKTFCRSYTRAQGERLRLELPIDHFRLLGVGPTCDAQTVLHTLQLRIDRAPQQGFTPETLQARSDVLRSTAELLTDSERREAYEADLTALASSDPSLMPALEFPSHWELAALLLLLEAGQPLECFELTCRALHPPQAPALGSGREADLALLAGLSCVAAAHELEQRRRYEQAARVLRQGMQQLQRMGQLPKIRLEIDDALRALRPYRVLDLLSRELTSSAERAEGLALLEELVQERGGLDASTATGMTASEFQTFFKQIRGYLTVQEQVDLFSRWASGSSAASFLAATALTASGFAQRKPERILEALARLQTSGQEALRPRVACLQLLVGQVEAAQASFAASADAQLRAWAEQQSDDPLAQLCAYCRDWLRRDVLPGYRDLEADPDLEAYFADRDVQAWVERQDHPAAPSSSSAEPVAEAPAENPFNSWNPELSWPDPGQEPAPGPVVQTEDQRDPAPRGRRRRAMASIKRLRSRRRRTWILAGGGFVVLVLLASFAAQRLLKQPPTPLPVESSTPGKPVPPKPEVPPAPVVPAPEVPAPAATTGLPLRADAPSDAQLRALLTAWLGAKAAVLAGLQPDQTPADLAGPIQVKRLEQQQAENRATSTTQDVRATVESFTVEERNTSRITATVKLRYSERPLDAAGQPVGPATELDLTNRYVFGRGADGLWRMVSFQRL
jgi:hypothetical protein